MKNTLTTTKRPGRPPQGAEPMTRFQLVIDGATLAAAEDEARRSGNSVSHVIREWIARGRKRDQPD